MVFSDVHPLAESDPAERTPARRETPAPEAADWLSNPAADAKPTANARYITMLENSPEWTGPLPSAQQDDDEEPAE